MNADEAGSDLLGGPEGSCVEVLGWLGIAGFAGVAGCICARAVPANAIQPAAVAIMVARLSSELDMADLHCEDVTNPRPAHAPGRRCCNALQGVQVMI
ncbi:MAG: hypothetical protein ACM3QY_02795 [Candidatus Levyibacteriota bacterium]